MLPTPFLQPAGEYHIGIFVSVARKNCPITATEEVGRPATLPLFVTYFLLTTERLSVGVSVIFLLVKAEPFNISGTSFFILSSICLFKISSSILFSSKGFVVNFDFRNYMICCACICYH